MLTLSQIQLLAAKDKVVSVHKWNIRSWDKELWNMLVDIELDKLDNLPAEQQAVIRTRYMT